MKPGQVAAWNLVWACAQYTVVHRLEEPCEDPDVKDVARWLGVVVRHAETHPDLEHADRVIRANQESDWYLGYEH